MKKNEAKVVPRPPVVVILGHVDHGKSTLLDYIRKTNVTEKEVGGITQRIAAYEISHNDKKITFLDTPGHEAFSKIRERGGKIADIAVLVIAADDGVKPQTIEAIKVIKENNLPYLVAINKIDKPGAEPQKVINQLTAEEVYLEGFGGNVPYVEISAKTGQGVNALLDLIVLLAELNNLTTDLSKKAAGVVIESHLDPKRGIAATLLIKDGTLKKGEFIVAEEALASTRIMENFLGEQISEAKPSLPILITGFNVLPKPGSFFETFNTKKEAEEKVAQNKEKAKESKKEIPSLPTEVIIIPIIIKGDFFGSIEAIEKEIENLKSEGILLKIIDRSVGDVNENDIKLAAGSQAIIVGLGIKIKKPLALLAEKENITIGIFSIIYELIDWLKKEIEKRRPRKEVFETRGRARVLKIFSQTKGKQIIGGEVFEGEIAMGHLLKIIRRNNLVGDATIIKLEKNRVKAEKIPTGSQFGLMLESKFEVAPGDILEAQEKIIV